MNSLTKVENGAGGHHDIAGAEWTWKVRSAQTDDSFCFFEMIVAPGQGVPLHAHSHPEAFYVLEGELEFHSNDAQSMTLRGTAGDVVLAGPAVQHSFFNRSGSKARLPSLSAAGDEAFFDAVATADKEGLSLQRHRTSSLPAWPRLARTPTRDSPAVRKG